MSNARMILNSKIANAESTSFPSTNGIVDWKFVIGDTAPNDNIKVFVRRQASGVEEVRVAQIYCSDWGSGTLKLMGRMKDAIDDTSGGSGDAVDADFSEEGTIITANVFNNFFYG